MTKAGYKNFDKYLTGSLEAQPTAVQAPST